MSGERLLQQAISQNTVVMFVTRYCPYCHRAKSVVSSLTSDVRVLDIDSMNNGGEVFNVIEKKFGHSTVPAIFIRGTFIGGCDDLLKLNSTGKLAQMLAANA